MRNCQIRVPSWRRNASANTTSSITARVSTTVAAVVMALDVMPDRLSCKVFTTRSTNSRTCVPLRCRGPLTSQPDTVSMLWTSCAASGRAIAGGTTSDASLATMKPIT